MSSNYPFHYKVVFRYIVYSKDNQITNKIVERVFEGDAPLINRKKAFAEVEEYLSYLKENNRVITNDQGNFEIVQPNFLVEQRKNFEKSHFQYSFKEEYALFKESISIYFVVENEDIARELDVFESEGVYDLEHMIFTVSTERFDQQAMIDNLELVEVEAYKLFGIDIAAIVEDVFHYGVDYGESGEDEESGAHRIILPVPFQWKTLEMYEEEISKYREEEDVPEISYKQIISRGESHQIEFKPTLVYNFDTGKGSIKVKYIIARVICSFLNSNGGTIFIGVKDDGIIQGLDFDYSLFEFGQKDKVLLELDSLISHYFGTSKKPLISGFIESIDGIDVLIIEVAQSNKPVFLNHQFEGKSEKQFFVRMNASTRMISDVEEIVDYIVNRKIN